MSDRLDRVRMAVDSILWAYTTARTADERDKIAAEIARLDGGGARLELADMAARDLASTRGGTDGDEDKSG